MLGVECMMIGMNGLWFYLALSIAYNVFPPSIMTLKFQWKSNFKLEDYEISAWSLVEGLSPLVIVLIMVLLFIF